jgi:hypothetical protein
LPDNRAPDYRPSETIRAASRRLGFTEHRVLAATVQEVTAFVPVQAVPDDAGPVPERCPIEIVRESPTVRVTRCFNPLTLDAVLSVLEARRC